MRTQELTLTELRAINGGADSAASSSTGIAIGADSLLSIGYSYSDGQGRSYESKLDILKDFHVGIGTTANNQQG